MNILVTGCAGFIGFHFCNNLLKKFKKVKIFGIDNFNNYYDVKLKKDRVKLLKKKFKSRIVISKIDLLEKKKIGAIFKKNKIKKVVHFAAQAGVRYSIKNPTKYIQSNIVGFQNIIDLSVKYKVLQLIYASSSSVYGGLKNKKLKESLNINDPIQLYAATKISNEMIANAYFKLYNISIVGLRFFTVYGPWGRPDMAPMIFTKSILKKKRIEIFNNGKNYRDFTYIDDIIDGVIKIFKNSENKIFDNKIYNIGNGKSINVLAFIKELEKKLKTKTTKNFVPAQPGDMVKTEADISKLKKEFNYKPKINFKNGINKFLNWYTKYYQTK
tara:strand:+ start:74 stop:1054 length:981 start_codon:yes stop_codon:yes gene_type:complete